jgi:hypothetical protein
MQGVHLKHRQHNTWSWMNLGFEECLVRSFFSYGILCKVPKLSAYHVKTIDNKKCLTDYCEG